MVSVPEGLTLGASGLVSRQMKRGERGSVPASRTFAEMFECEASGRDCAGLTAGPKNLMLSSWKLFTKQIMTSNEDAEIRKHVYKPLKRGSPTPLYYPLSLSVECPHAVTHYVSLTELSAPFSAPCIPHTTKRQ